MFCEKCGTENNDAAQFCTGCGAKLNGEQTPSSDISVEVEKSNKNRKIGVIAVAAVAVAVLVVILFVGIFGGRSYEKTVDECITAVSELDVKTLCKLVPKKVLDKLIEEAGFDEADELIDYIDESISDYRDNLNELGEYIESYYWEYYKDFKILLAVISNEDVKVFYEITNVEDVKGIALESLKSDYNDMDVKVAAAKTVEIEFTLKTGKNKSSSSLEIPLIKVGDSWYLDLVSLAELY